MTVGPFDPWFDDECRAAKRGVRHKECAARRADSTTASIAAAEWYTARRTYRTLLRRKKETFWQVKIDAESSTPRRLWKSIDARMGRGSVPASSTIGPMEFHLFFDAKVASVRASTADAPPPTFTAVRSGCSFQHFDPISVDDVAAAIRENPIRSAQVIQSQLG